MLEIDVCTRKAQRLHLKSSADKSISYSCPLVLANDIDIALMLYSSCKVVYHEARQTQFFADFFQEPNKKALNFLECMAKIHISDELFFFEISHLFSERFQKISEM